ncbi:hypothetical protein BOO35_15620 [Vibrio navarrensis]|uniref:hypothetical protein n=1 Tax=Vibrio navarrensis TaxID=29495 RepID=UPI001868C72F|nr:hypothetical protein [Vibrio navarrensis]MBE3666504.1 hypothetical protein [Vibrio navarrensis]MBE4587106.1 hypothetical protein [Vibrio navarrensis]MBE4601475.1 hypothetical protein [Vibrio navarrensis]
MKVVVEFLESGRFRDNFWDGEFRVERGEHRTVSPSLAAQLIHNRQASLYRFDDSDHAADINPADGAPMK